MKKVIPAGGCIPARGDGDVRHPHHQADDEPAGAQPACRAEHRPGGLYRQRAGHQAADDRPPEHPVHRVEMDRDGQQPALNSGPGSKTPWASRVACPTIGPCAVSSLHDRSAMAASSPTGRQPRRMRRAGPRMKGSHAARCATARSAVRRPGRRSTVARRIFSRAFLGSGPPQPEAGMTRGARKISVHQRHLPGTESVLTGDIPTNARFRQQGASSRSSRSADDAKLRLRGRRHAEPGRACRTPTTGWPGGLLPEYGDGLTGVPGQAYGKPT